MHYDTTELPTPIARTCRLMHIASLLAAIALSLNLINVCVLLITDQQKKPIYIAYSLLNMVIGIPAYTFIFYTGYRSLAMSLTGPYRTLLHQCLQLLGLFFAFYFMLSPHGPFNGIIRFSNTETTGYWIVAVLLEAPVWLGVVILGIWTSWKVYRFNPYESQESRAGVPR